jgi:chitinase
MMKMKFAYISLLLLILSINIHAQFKVVGYIRPRADMLADLKKVDLTKITHLNLAFINPDTSGNFKNMMSL